MDREARVERFATGASEQPGHAALSLNELAQVVHDFKSPLCVVTLEMQALLGRLTGRGHTEMVDPITRVLLNLDYLDRLVQDLLDSCAIDAGQFSLHPRRVDLAELLRSVVRRMTGARDRNRVVMEVPDRIVTELDPLRIERVIANFVQNALKYSPPNARIVARLDTSAGVARASVIDSGPGISHDDAEHVFEEYRRAPNSRDHEGSGLGLYVSKRIVEAHGGRVGVESVLGVGSKFYFELPLH